MEDAGQDESRTMNVVIMIRREKNANSKSVRFFATKMGFKCNTGAESNENRSLLVKSQLLLKDTLNYMYSCLSL